MIAVALRFLLVTPVIDLIYVAGHMTHNAYRAIITLPV